MIHLISAPSCATAWLQAASLLMGTPGRYAYNVLLDIADPIATSREDRRIIKTVDGFLKSHGGCSIEEVAETIFPEKLFLQKGREGVLKGFPEKIYPTLSKNWGTYAGRMLVRESRQGERINPLAILIEKLSRQVQLRSTLRSAYELSLADVFTDLPLHEPGCDARRTLNQPCLVHLSFKIQEPNRLMLTALYRSHYYVQRALGNLIGLGRMLAFVAEEAGLEPGSLVCHSTFARIDVGGWNLGGIKRLLAECYDESVPRA